MARRCTRACPPPQFLKAEHFVVLGVSAGASYALACARYLPWDWLLGAGICGDLDLAHLGLPSEDAQRLLAHVARAVNAAVPRPNSGWGIGMVPMAPDVENPDKFEQTLSDAMSKHPEMRQSSARVIRRRHLRCVAGEYGAHVSKEAAGVPLGISSCTPARGGYELQLPDGEGSYDSLARDGDMNVTVATPEKTAGLIPNAELLLSPGDTHISLVPKKADEIVAASSSMFDEHVV